MSKETSVATMKIEKDQGSLENPVPFLNDDYSAITINDSDNDEPSLVIDQGQDVKPSNEVKRWEIDLSNNVILKDGHQEPQLCPKRQQTARKSISTDKLDASCSTQSQDTDLLPKPAGFPGDDRWKTVPKICNFPCPICKGLNRYSANDLQKHYWYLHRGQLPNYPCEMCSFSSPDFQTFTRHLYSHRNTLAKCDICNTEGRYSLLDLTKHYVCMHSVKGHFSCEKCIFQTRDVGTFVQHMHRHSEEQSQDLLMGHTKRIGFQFNCQYCPYSSTLREQFANHVRVIHRDKLNAKDLRKDNCNIPQHTQAALKLVLKRQAAEQNAQVLMKCKAEHLSQPSTNCTVNGGNYTKAGRADETLNAEAWPSASATLSNVQDNGTVACLLKSAVHGPTVLTVKNNKITVPENYCAKFVGFKEVDGKRHIVIKLLPANKPDLNPAESSKESSLNLHQTSVGINVKCEPTSSAANGQLPLSQVQLGNACSRSTPFLATNFPAKAKFEKPNMLSHIAPSSLLEVKSMPQTPAQSASLSNAAFFASNGENITMPSAAHVLQTTSALHEITSYDKNQDHSVSSDPTISQANGPCVNPERCLGDCEQLPLLKNGNSDLEKGLQTLHKTTSLYSIQNPPASSFFPRKKGQVILNSGNEKPTSIAVGSRLHVPCVPQSGNTFSTKGRSSMVTRSLRGSTRGTFMEGDGTLNCNAPNAGKSEIDNRADTTLCNSQDGRLTKIGDIGTILKAHSNAIITQQLVKEKLGGNLQNSNILSSAQIVKPQTLPEGSRVLIASTPQSLLLPLNFATQQGLQVVAGGAVSSSNLTGVQTANGVPPFAMLSTRPGVVLTFSGGAIGAVANIATVGSQVMGSVAQSNADDPKLSNANHSDTSPFTQPAASLLNQGTKVSIQGPFIVTNSMNTPVQVAAASPQVTGLPPDTILCQYRAAQGDFVTASSNLQSVKLQHAAQQKPTYAVLPDGRRAVLLKYAPSGDVRDSLQANVQNQNVQPWKVEGSKQKYFLKVVKNTTTGVQMALSTQSALNTSLESLKFDGVRSIDNNFHFNVPAVSSSNVLSDSVLRPKNSLSGSTTASLPPDESLHPPKQLKTLSQKDSSSSAQEVHISRRGSSLRQQASWNLRKDNISKHKCEAAQGDSKFPETETEKRNKRARRRSKAQIEEPPRKKMSSRKCKEKNPAEEENESTYTFEPRLPKDSTKTLRLLPFSLNQTVKCPRRNQPVVVLNHPDTDFPEVINLMKTIAKFKGHVLKVSLSRRTMQALLHQTYGISSEISTRDTTARSRRTIMPVSPVKERFVLKLTLKKTSKNIYKIVKPCTENTLKATFSCWFCGRIFHNQDEWIGHGQRHLMEATRGWNTLVQ